MKANLGCTRPSRRDELLAPSARSPDPVRDRGDVERVDEHRRAARNLLHRGPHGCHNGRPARHRLEHGQPEALVERRIEDTPRAAVQGCELRVRDLAHPAVRLDPTPPARANHAQLDSGLSCSRDRAPEILARLERRDGEDVVACRARAVRAEDGIDAVPHNADPLRGNPGQLDRLVAAELGDRDHRIGSPENANEPRATVEPMPPREDLRGTEDR